ncbi:PAM2 domain-containing protein [Trichinella spiralis]|uniref:PAM2 domain-containing protein n=1 Tax=Trichinella spiralis TaxID=6334 RepID=A0ABR3KTS0_TRISP
MYDISVILYTMTESNENEKVCDALESIEQQITDKERQIEYVFYCIEKKREDGKRAKDYLMKQKAIVQNIRASDDILTERQATMQTLIEHQEQINSKMAETYYLLKDKKKHLKMELASLKKEISSRKDAFEHNVNSTVDHVDQLRCARKGLQFAVKYKEKLDAAKEINGKINALKDEIMEQKNYLEQLNISHDKYDNFNDWVKVCCTIANFYKQNGELHDKVEELSAEMANCENCDQDIVVQSENDSVVKCANEPVEQETLDQQQPEKLSPMQQQQSYAEPVEVDADSFQGQCEQQELGNCDAVDDDNLSVSENGSFGPNFLKNTFSAEKDALQLMEFQNEDNISTGSAVEENVTVAKNVDLLEMMATPIAGLSIEENENTQTESELSFVYTNNMQNMSTNFSNFGNASPACSESSFGLLAEFMDDQASQRSSSATKKRKIANFKFVSLLSNVLS